MKKLVVLLLAWFIISTSVSAQNGTNLKRLETLAKQGDLAAQIELANGYRKGIGVNQDYKTAVKWFTLAAEQGNALAQYNLGQLYYLGKGVPENLVCAHMWANQASSNGFKMGSELTELLTELMTTNQIKQARKLGKECVIKNYKGC